MSKKEPRENNNPDFIASMSTLGMVYGLAQEYLSRSQHKTPRQKYQQCMDTAMVAIENFQPAGAVGEVGAKKIKSYHQRFAAKNLFTNAPHVIAAFSMQVLEDVGKIKKGNGRPLLKKRDQAQFNQVIKAWGKVHAYYDRSGITVPMKPAEDYDIANKSAVNWIKRVHPRAAREMDL